MYLYILKRFTATAILGSISAAVRVPELHSTAQSTIVSPADPESGPTFPGSVNDVIFPSLHLTPNVL